VTDPLGRTTTYDYTGLSRVSVTDPLGHETSRFLDAGGRPVLFVDALGNRTSVAYDGANRVLRTIDAAGAETGFAYDPNGNLTSLTDARGNVTSFAYDSMDRVERATDPLGAADAYTYDEAGNLVRHTDRRGVVSTFDYDPLGHQVRAAYGVTGAGAESTVTSTYDGGDRLVLVDDSAYGTVELAYDGLDRITRRTTPEGAVAYGYDDAGQRTSMTVGEAETTYGYDDAGRLTSIERGSTRGAVTRDEAGRVTRTALPNGVTTDYGYDEAGRLTSIAYAAGDSALGDLGYRYDPLGRRVDVSGSLARTILPEAVPSASYDAANRLTAWGATAFTYDAAGNLTGDGTDTYTWDARGQLAAIAAGGEPRASFAYDPFGRRTTRTVGGNTTTYLYDGINVLRETVDGGSPVTYLTGLSADDVLARIDADGTTSYLTDGLGSVVGLVDQAGRLATEYSYGAFGATESSGDRPDDPNPFRFTGREDDGTGLYYYRARYYRPDVNRFIAEDPLGYAAGDPNLYAYVSNSPTNAVDPSGMCGVDAILDLGFLAYDVYALFRDGRKNLGENLLAGAADLAGLLIPCASGGGAAVRAARAADDAYGAAAAARHADDAGDAARAGSRAPCSFDGDTEVLMADGSTKPIEDVQVGDRVRAAAPETGERGIRRVTAVQSHEDRLSDLELEGGGRVTTTEDHPFWNATDGQWQETQDLDPGDELLAADGDPVRVSSLDGSGTGRDTAYDLTVEDLSSYYVSTGDDEVLVHNCGVDDVLRHIDDTGSAPPGYRGGRTFQNDGRGGGQVLPGTDAGGNPVTYREWDVKPHTRGVNRGAERLVTGSDGSAWYTADHYGTFTRVR
jgi:RHS repeat-associated protein